MLIDNHIINEITKNMSPKKITALKLIRDKVSQKFVGSNNVLLTCVGKIYEAQGQHNVKPLQDIGINKFKKSCRAEIPIASMNSVNDKMTKNGYNMYVIYSGDAGAVHYHPFNKPDMTDRRSELSQQQRVRLECLKLLRKKQRKSASAVFHTKSGVHVEVRKNEINSWVRNNVNNWRASRFTSRLSHHQNLPILL